MDNFEFLKEYPIAVSLYLPLYINVLEELELCFV